MVRDYFTDEEVAEELGLDIESVKMLLDGTGEIEWLTEDVDKLIARLARVAGHPNKRGKKA